MYLGDRSREFISAMRARGILVRDRSRDYGCKDCVRITVGIAEHNQRLLASLREVFSEIGLRQKVAR
jgi:histidinol-phosphate aminotransferase